MNYYNAIVPDDLVEKLYKAGCPNIGRYEREGKELYTERTYADVLDGLIEKGLCVAVHPRYDSRWCADVEDSTGKVLDFAVASSFEGAVNHAILSASVILKEK